MSRTVHASSWRWEPYLKFHVTEELLSWRATGDCMLCNALYKQTPYTAGCTAPQNSCSFHVFPCAFMCCFQSKFKSQGTKLIPDCAGSDNNCALIALIMQRVFEGNTLHQKMGTLTLSWPSEHTCWARYPCMLMWTLKPGDLQSL